MEAVSNPFNGKAMAAMRVLTEAIRKGRVEVTKLHTHTDTHNAGRLYIECETAIVSRRTRRKGGR